MAAAGTSAISPIPTASYQGQPRNAMSMGDSTVAADIPTNPTPIPDANPDAIQTINIFIIGISPSFLYILTFFFLYYKHFFRRKQQKISAGRRINSRFLHILKTVIQEHIIEHVIRE